MNHTNCLHAEGESCVFCRRTHVRDAAARALSAIAPNRSQTTTTPTFERCADATLEKVRAIYASRGVEYADSWALENQITTYLDSTLAMMGLTDVPAAAKRLLQLACLIDVKDSRMGGPFKADSVIDSLAYRATYLTLREEYEAV